VCVCVCVCVCIYSGGGAALCRRASWVPLPVEDVAAAVAGVAAAARIERIRIH
jgi:hypothetical protein